MRRAWNWVATNDPVDTLVGGFLAVGLLSVLLIIGIGTIWTYVL